MANVTIWNEYRQERSEPAVREVYPDGIHEAVAAGLDDAHDVRTATLDEPEHGLAPDVLDWTDVLLWWGHVAHDAVEDAVVERVKRRVLDGMGLIALHSAHESKPFTSLMGTTGSLRWRERGERERLWVVEPGHPIADGLDEYFELPRTEMYGERFDVPAPDALVFISWFEGGEVFRSGCCYRRGNGRVFYFRPGHEEFPVYHDPTVRRVLANAVAWAAPGDAPPASFETVEVTEPPEGSDGTSEGGGR